ncbi:MAG: MotA/TolQ/ExbB proton channel family protein [Verrucomicrobiae bacterium]|nr:MotA/TolQ/ExbB proton channel family protein [Verrucomicrobiae bacterium]MDW8308491.1 MotA/TolQ/ExbB proton channel family protein [Verrucomicrobiales bacterium]
MMLANILVKYFEAGGPIMWPILITAIVAVAVVGERIVWWAREARKRDPATLEKIFAALENGDFKEAARLSKDSEDPVIRMIWHGINHHHASLQGALQVAAGAELQKAGRFLTVMDTLVTLAPLLGLLGTVAGIFRTFIALGDQSVEGAMGQITGGIGEALIATMCGLAIAIFALIPFNYFSRKLAQLEFELQSAATNVEVMVQAAKQRGYETQVVRQED